MRILFDEFGTQLRMEGDDHLVLYVPCEPAGKYGVEKRLTDVERERYELEGDTIIREIAARVRHDFQQELSNEQKKSLEISNEGDKAFIFQTQLRTRFGEWQSHAYDTQWKDVKGTLLMGTNVVGKVIATARFGVFVDLGMAFPALILLPNLRDARLYKPYSEDEFPPMGSSIDGTVVGFSDCEREIMLFQEKTAESEADSPVH